MSLEMKEMLATFPHLGTVEWIGLRPAKRAAIKVVDRVLVGEAGLEGDRFDGGPTAPRMVTLIQQEHLAVVAALLRQEAIDPALLRRNLVVSGISLQSLKERQFRIGSAVLLGTGNCPPCSRMEENLGPGGYNAMRGHGGITARVIEGGQIEIGSKVQPLLEESADESE